MKSPNRIHSVPNKMIILSVIVILFNIINKGVYAVEEERMSYARALFYQSVEDAQKVEKAISLFNEIGEESEEYEGLALTYIGALTALKGKFAFFPITKYRHVMQGLQLMDQGILKSPDNIEARFIRGMTCYYLPFFFHRKKTAHEDFKMIVKLLDTAYIIYDTQMIMHVTDFLLEHADLNDEEIQKINNIQNLINDNEG